MDDTIPQDTPQKQCTVCKHTFPATTEFFHRDKHTKDGFVFRCKVCVQTYQKDLYADPVRRARLYAQNKDYQRENRERIQVQKRGYFNRPEIRERLRSQAQEYRADPVNQERAHAYYTDYYADPVNHERLLAYQKDYRASVYADPQKRAEFQAMKRIRSHTRRARQLNAPGTHTVQDMQRIYKAQKGKCYWCYKPIAWKGRHDDHIIPITRGGTNWPDNMCVSCPQCNLRKFNKLPHEWDGSGGRLF